MRTYTTEVPLDYASVKGFFDERGRKMSVTGPLTAVLYQDKNPALAARRSEHELAFIGERLARLGPERSALDIGCGTGRWAKPLSGVCRRYLGLDFCLDFLQVARESARELPCPERFEYQQADLSQGFPEGLGSRRFDLVMDAGLLLYLNDPEVEGILDELASLITSNAWVYFREPLGIEKRLTLKEHYSEEMQTSYSSIYRSHSEFLLLIERFSARSGLPVRESGPLYPPELDNRLDTRQYYFILGGS